MIDKRFGRKIRNLREKRRRKDRSYSLRSFAARIGMSPAYLSKIERGEFPPPAEDKIKAIAEALDIDSDELLALAGKISSDIPEIIRRRPALLTNIIRRMEDMEDDDVERVFRIVKDGKW